MKPERNPYSLIDPDWRRWPQGVDMRERIERLSVPVTESGCWLWLGKTNGTSYGQFTTTGPQRVRGAHRVSFETYIDPIPEGMCVCHSCDTPSCVNPAHLWLGTRKDNSADMLAKRRLPSRAGTNNYNAKLTADQAREIRQTKGQTTNVEAAALFGVSRSCVADIRSGKKWTHI